MLAVCLRPLAIFEKIEKRDEVNTEKNVPGKQDLVSLAIDG